MTASIGIVIGLGFYFPAFLATLLTIITLSAFRWIESRLPAQVYANFSVRFMRSKPFLDEIALRHVISKQGITAYEASYKLEEKGSIIEYEMTIRSTDRAKFRKLAQCLTDMDEVYEFRIIPT